MEFRKVLALRGPNIWANFPVLEAWVDLGPLKDSPSDELPGFNERLKAWLPSLVEHRCSVGTRGGFFERLRRGTYQAHILEHVALELQTLAGTDVGFGRTRETSEDGVYKVALEYEDEELGRACFESARELCLAAVYDRPFDVEGELRRLRAIYQRGRPAPGTAAVLRAAARRRIPVRRLDAANLLELGYGHRRRRLLGAQTDQTGALAESIAENRDLLPTLMHAAGVPFAADQDPDAAPYRLLVVGERVVAAARRTSPGGPTEDVTDRVHPDVAAHAVEAACIVGLEVAGVRVLAEDLGRPLEEQGGALVGFEAHPDPALGLDAASPRLDAVGDALLDQLFPQGQTGRIPIAAVTGVNGKTTTTRLLAHIVARTHRCVGMTCTEGIYVGGRRIEVGDCSGPKSARAVLHHPRVEAAVLETARGGILREGLGFGCCDVAVVTNIGEGDHLGLHDIDTLEKLARVKRTIVDVVTPEGAAVLYAADPLVAEMAGHCPGGVVFFNDDAAHPVMEAHREKGGRTAFVRDGHVVLAEGDQEIPLVPLAKVPLTHGGRVRFQVLNVLAAAAAAWSLGVPCEAIRVGLETFVPDLENSPGRFNLFEIRGAAVVVDYGHNTSSLAALLEALAVFPHRRRTAVYSTAGDRRDCDLVRQGELLGHAFDRVVLYEDHYRRGRKEGEIMALLHQGLRAGRRVREVQEVVGWVKALEAALHAVRPGDLLLIQADEIDEAVEVVRRFQAAGKVGRLIDFREAVQLGRSAAPVFAAAAAPVEEPSAV